MGASTSKTFTFEQRKDEIIEETRRKIEEAKKLPSDSATPTTKTAADTLQDLLGVNLGLGNEALDALAVYKQVYERLLTDKHDVATLIEPMLFGKATGLLPQFYYMTNYSFLCFALFA